MFISCFIRVAAVINHPIQGTIMYHVRLGKVSFTSAEEKYGSSQDSAELASFLVIQGLTFTSHPPFL